VTYANSLVEDAAMDVVAVVVKAEVMEELAAVPY
jgi:hypothetical protein